MHGKKFISLAMHFFKKLTFFPAVLFFLLTLILLCLPGSSFPKQNWFSFVHLDKIIHISLFTTLCLLFNIPLKFSPLTNSKRKQWFWMICLSSIAFGIIMEFVQKFWISNRSFELMDIVADSTGCLFALWISSQKFLAKN